MSSGQIQLYHKEILDFLRTVTIKFEPFAYLMGQDYMTAHGVNNPHEEWNPYYIHLTGEYTKEELATGTNLMYVYTVEKELPERILFDKNLVNTHPKTAALYRVPNDEYTHLQEQYPQNLGLIQNIVYPVESIEAAIEAPNLSLLAYDASMLETNERESIISCLRNFLDMVKTRWWINEYTYEDMYAITFWGMLWQLLPMVLLYQRFDNIKTPYVHSFHVWEYLTSKGLGDYRDVLTTNQALWLYRNIDYIQKNKGKESNLHILAKNLLNESYISLLYKDMYQSSVGFRRTLVTRPNFLSFNAITNEHEKTEQMDDLNPRLVKSGLEVNSSAQYIKDTEVKLGTHNYNILPTKFLEFKKDSIDTSNYALSVNFFLHTLMYRLSENKLSYNVKVSDPFGGTSIKLYVADMFLLCYYCSLRSVGITPTYIPKTAYVSLPFIMAKPRYADVNDDLYLNKLTNKTECLIDIEYILDNIPWVNKVAVDIDDFTTMLTKQWNMLQVFVRNHDNSNSLWYHTAMKVLLLRLRHRGVISLANISSYTHFSEWIASNAAVSALIDSYEKSGDISSYDLFAHMAVASYDALFNTAENTNTVRRLSKIYNAVRDLFISLCSYNVTYLDSDRTTKEYLKIDDPDFLIGITEKYKYSVDIFSFIVKLTVDNLHSHWKNKLRMRGNNIELQYNIHKLGQKEYFIEQFDNSLFVRPKKIKIFDYRTKLHYNKLEQTSAKVVFKFTLHTGITHITHIS
jgi:hypothetical protein